MPHYFFRIHDGVDIEDREGADYPDLDAAIKEAIEGAREVLASGDREGRDRRHWWMIVHDGEGQDLAKVHFADTLTPDNPNPPA